MDAERSTLECEELDEQATLVAESLNDFQELWNVTEKPLEKQGAPRKKVLGDLCEASSTLCVALAHLIYLQTLVGQDKRVIDLTCDWEVVVKQRHNEIYAEVHEVNGTSDFEYPFPNNTWVGSWFLGEGAFGTASMYAKLDHTGNVINRVVVKNCDLNQAEDNRDLWDNDPSFFAKDDDGKKFPLEIVTMFDLRGKQGSEYIVKILNWRIAEKRKFYRIYLEVSSPVYRSTIQTTDELAVRRPS